MMKTADLYDQSRSLAGEYLAAFEYPWQALAGIRELIPELGRKLGPEFREVRPRVWIHSSAVIAPNAWLGDSCIIGAHAQVRHCAFLRGGVLVGEDCVVGNSVEVKNAILFDGVQVPHFNYVGDSILGYKAHLGAGAVTSNVKSDRTPVVVKDGEGEIRTGLTKCGAMLGDFVEVGCNSVLNPGTLVGRHSHIYPNSCVRGVVPANSIWKTGGIVVDKR